MPADSPVPSMVGADKEAPDAEAAPQADASEEAPLAKAARATFGLRRWDCAALYRETADAATDTDLPFWTVLLLSGAIATLGLALDQTAVVIGAMLIAPLLGPLLGLSLALAIGDARLAAQTFLTILLAVVGVVGLAALLTALLPVQNVTPEIAARTRPTTLDLGIAVASGLAGAVVTVSREKRLSASIPGVAIAVALIPPLGVAGFGIGAGEWTLIKGSLLLFGANLGGIVLSGMLAFLLVGMHRPDVREAAQRWHREGERHGVAARLERTWLYQRLRVFASPWARVGLVLAFVGAVAVPLSTSLGQFVRETRVEGGVRAAVEALQAEGRASVLSRDVHLLDDRTEVRLRVATAEWIGEDERQQVQMNASAAAGEPLVVDLDQLVASEGRLDSLLAARSVGPPVLEVEAPGPEATLGRLQAQVTGVFASLALPDSVRMLGAEVALGAQQGAALHLIYAAPQALPASAEAMLVRQAAAALGLAPAAISAEAVALRARPLPSDALVTTEIAGLLARFPDLRLELRADSAAAAEARGRFEAAGVASERLRVTPGTPPSYRLAIATDE